MNDFCFRILVFQSSIILLNYFLPISSTEDGEVQMIEHKELYGHRDSVDTSQSTIHADSRFAPPKKLHRQRQHHEHHPTEHTCSIAQEG